MKATIAYVTGRRTPRWEWFCDSLCAQTTPEQRADLQVVFIDGHCWGAQASAHLGLGDIELLSPLYRGLARKLELEAAVADRFPFLHIPPKPCAYQGPFRQTTRDMFCAGNSRNTAFLVAQHSYVVFVDDLSVLMPGWFNNLIHAANDGYVAAGAYKKVLKLSVSGGRVDSYERHLVIRNVNGREEEYDAGLDSRWNNGSDGGVVPWHGAGLFGCSFGVPLEAALEVDGNDLACLAQGGEDTDFGIRLERAGWPVFYNRNLLTIESEELHHDGSKLPQERKLCKPELLPKAYETYMHVRPAEKYYSDHVVLNRLINEANRSLPLIGENLREQRDYFQRTGLVKLPRANQLDWRDGQPLSEL